MLDIIFSLAVIFQASAIALGVGSSTLVITSFLVAIHDGQIDASERRMLGVIYWLLRASMIWIAVTTAIVMYIHPEFFSDIATYLWVLIAILFLNATAMTKHWISSKIGPALQAATWYTLGFTVTIHMFDLFYFTDDKFVVLYALDIAFALTLVNGFMYYRARNGVVRK
jgi:hypothetical protein